MKAGMAELDELEGRIGGLAGTSGAGGPMAALSPRERMLLACHPGRPGAMELARGCGNDFLELSAHGAAMDGTCVSGGFAYIGNAEAAILAVKPGKELDAVPLESAAEFAGRLLRLAGKSGMPFVAIVDAPGEGWRMEILERLYRVESPLLCVYCGRPSGLGASLGVQADMFFEMEYPALAFGRQAASSVVVEEPFGGAHRDAAQAGRLLGRELAKGLDGLGRIPLETLLARRLGRVRKASGRADGVEIRAAREDEVEAIHGFFAPFVSGNQILPRSQDDIREHLANFRVAADSTGRIVGTVALRDFGDGLHEIRSLAVSPAFEGHGIGTELVLSAVELARCRNARKVFTLTMKPGLFQHCGFSHVSMMRFPGKVQNDCLQCPKKELCDETALVLYL